MGLPGKPVQAQPQPQAPLQGQSQADVPCQTLCRDDGAGSLGWAVRANHLPCSPVPWHRGASRQVALTPQHDNHTRIHYKHFKFRRNTYVVEIRVIKALY